VFAAVMRFKTEGDTDYFRVGKNRIRGDLQRIKR